MKTKIGVQFRKTNKTQHTFERLKYCKNCHSYSILWNEECTICDKEETLVPIKTISLAITRRNVQTRFLWIGLFACLSAIFADTTEKLLLACGGGLLLFLLFGLMQKQYGIYEKEYHFKKHLKAEQRNIKDSLLRQLDEIDADVQEKRIKDAYEKIREVGYFLDSDLIKILKLKYLNHFVLRKDMDLELDTLIPSDYNKHFILYLHEALKVQPWLVNRAVLEYVIKYMPYIEQRENGNQILGQVAGASLRVKANVYRYQDFIIEVIDFLPKERVLRLAKIVKSEQEYDWTNLYEATKKHVDQHYAFDPDFKGVL
ncbi:hypothetical protein [Brevibacillus daliensis]|uniref:hypothetical protein n=1 Tax=Brevibacillus daliensis TaxID=2892995 RepID=UPI001E596689|nr:hypothetical protein [Brevibacillus daliensis]